MILVYLFIYIPAAFVLYVVLRGIFSKDTPPQPMPKSKNGSSGFRKLFHIDKNSALYTNPRMKRYYSERGKRK